MRKRIITFFITCFIVVLVGIGGYKSGYRKGYDKGSLDGYKQAGVEYAHTQKGLSLADEY